MFELIPSLLAQQNIEPVKANSPTPIETASVPQQKPQASPLTSAPAVAIPESTAIPESKLAKSVKPSPQQSSSSPAIPESTLVKSSVEQASPSAQSVKLSKVTLPNDDKKAAAQIDNKENIENQKTEGQPEQTTLSTQPIQPQASGTIAPQASQVQEVPVKRESDKTATTSIPKVELPSTKIPPQTIQPQNAPVGEVANSESVLPSVQISQTSIPVFKLKPLIKTASNPKVNKKPSSTIARSTIPVQKNGRTTKIDQKQIASATPSVQSSQPTREPKAKVIKSGVTLPKVKMPSVPPAIDVQKIANSETTESTISQSQSLPNVSTNRVVSTAPIAAPEQSTLPNESISANPATAPEQSTPPDLFKPRNQSVPTFNPRRIEIVKPSPSGIVSTAKSSGLVDAAQRPTKAIPVSIARQQQGLEQKLAEIVARDRATKQAQQQANTLRQREALIRQAYDYATQRRFDRARQILQAPSLSNEERDPVLITINDLEIASRSLGVTKVAEAPPKLQTVGQKTKLARTPIKEKPSVPVVIVEQPTALTRPPKAPTVIPVPKAPLFRSQNVAVSIPVPAPAKSDAGAISSAQVVKVNPQNLQAYNRNLPGQNQQRDKLLYPLPEPVPVTSKFGWRIHPVTRVKRLHAGVDLGAAQGTPILASRAGRVAVADRMGGYGLTIVLQHNDGSQDTLYAHLSQIFVRPGEKIQPGTVIGKVGSTGVSTGPHLHYEARRMTNTGWIAYDPGPQIEAARVRLVQERQMNARSSQANGDKES